MEPSQTELETELWHHGPKKHARLNDSKMMVDPHATPVQLLLAGDILSGADVCHMLTDDAELEVHVGTSLRTAHP